MRLRHRVHTSATPAQVWQVVGDPLRWPEFDLLLAHVRGGHGPAMTGQHLLGIGRGFGMRIPLDVVEAVPDRRLVLRISAVPGVVEEITHEITPVVRGGCDITVSVVVEGLFARGAALPLWLSRGLTSRVLASRVERLARAARQAA
jgi:hypothetical protein